MRANFGGLDFEGVFFGEVAEFLQVLVAEHGVVVEVDLAVECDELAVLGGDEGVDLHEGGVGFDERFVKAGHEGDGLVDLGGFEAELEGEGPGLVGLEADGGVYVFLVDEFGGGVGDLFDFHAAGLRGHEDDFGAGAVEDEAEVELTIDGGAFFDEEALDFLSGCAGLVRDQGHAEDGLAGGVRGFEVFGELDAAALAAAPGVDLRFDDDDCVAGGEELLGGGIGLLKRGDHFACGDGHVVFAQDVFGLVLVNFHGLSSLQRNDCFDKPS